MTTTSAKRIAYFSMEVGVDNRLPTFSGGLGVLAGDTLKSAADLGLPLVAMTMLYHKGYFAQSIDAAGKQQEAPVTWRPETVLTKLDTTVSVTIDEAGRAVKIGCWRYDVKGASGHVVPIYFLDTNLEGNHPDDRTLTDHLYGGDERYRLRQEVILGIGGVTMLAALGMKPAATLEDTGLSSYHMNEGHAALLAVALLKHKLQGKLAGATDKTIAWVKERTVFTTHTPVEAGHDTFPVALAKEILGGEVVDLLSNLEVCPNGRLNMSLLAIRFSRFVNGVAKRHAEVSREMFPRAKVAGITNGVHAATWTHPAIQAVLDDHVAGWRTDNDLIRYGAEIPLPTLAAAHAKAKAALLAETAKRTGVTLDSDAFTIGFARRAAEYKRADLLFDDPSTLARIAQEKPIQILFSGKAHPRDMGGKALIERVVAAAKALKGRVTVVYIPGYDMDLGLMLTAGVDLWLNNPVKPLEASGTSGMKAALNGVPSLSTLDGWWVEGCVDGVTGWEIGDETDGFAPRAEQDRYRAAASRSLLDRLEKDVLPLYYNDRDGYLKVMRQAIFLNGSYFNTQRMVAQYARMAYNLAP